MNIDLSTAVVQVAVDVEDCCLLVRQDSIQLNTGQGQVHKKKSYRQSPMGVLPCPLANANCAAAVCEAPFEAKSCCKANKLTCCCCWLAVLDPTVVVRCEP